MDIKMLLINRESICLYSKNFESEISTDPLLISGFLSAISSFAQDISQDQVKGITMGRSKISYCLLDEKSDLNIVIIADQSCEDNELSKILEKLGFAFLDMFEIREINLHAHDSSYFEPFENYVNNVIQEINQATIDEVIDELKIFSIEKPPRLENKELILPFLFKKLKNDMAKIIYSLFIGKRIVVTGDPAIVKSTIDSLEILSPHRLIKKVYWTENFEETNADIIGVPPSLSAFFIDSTIVNLDNYKVMGIKSIKYFENLVKKIKKLDQYQIGTFITKKFNILIEKTKELSHLINTENISNQDLENFAEKIDREILEILETELKINYPRSINRIKMYCDKIRIILKKFKFVDWVTGLD